MDRDSLFIEATSFLRTSPLARVCAQDAIRPDLAEMRIYDEPLFAVGDANDPLFEKLKDPGVVHEEHLLPGDWLPGARRVISFFLPFTT